MTRKAKTALILPVDTKKVLMERFSRIGQTFDKLVKLSHLINPAVGASIWEAT